LGTEWKAGRIGNVDLVSYSGVVELCSRGAASDALVQAIADAYGVSVAPAVMAGSTKFAAISLAGDPTRLDGGPVKLKLFFESTDETRYAELYLNVDAKQGTVQLDEKDPEYRKAVLLALVGGKPESGK